MNIFGSNKELQILKRFGRGDASAMDMLYADYADYLTGVCCRYIGNEDDRKDVLQEAFIKIFTSIGHFSYRGEGSLKAWVTRIAVNEALQYLRQQCRWSPIDSDAPLPYRAVFNLFAIEGLSHKEIARQLGITPSTSASQYFKARAMLARMIKENKK